MNKSRINEGSHGVISGTEIRVPKGAGYGYFYSLVVDGGQYTRIN